MTDKEYLERRLAGNKPEKEERLNESVPEGTLIKMLAKEKRNLQLENLELKRMVAVLKEDNEALKKYCDKLVAGSGAKDMTKLINGISNLWGQISKKIEPIKDLCNKTDELKDALLAFVEQCEKQTDN